MATSVDIAPSAGHGVLFTQAGVGASPGYDAIDWRRVIECAAGWQAGVFGATEWQVIQNTGGANATVQVRANLGCALIDADGTLQGRYIVAPHSGFATIDAAAGHATLPRLDYVVLEVQDHTVDGSGQNRARVRYITGTATSGATHANGVGAPTLPDGAILLAQLLRPAASSTVSTSQIRDRRRWARGARVAYRRTAGDYTVNSGSHALVDATNMGPGIECSGAPIRVRLSGSITAGTTTNAYIGLMVDGALIAGTERPVSVEATLNGPIDMTWDYTPAAGRHVIGPCWKVDGAVLTTLQGDATEGAEFVLDELNRPASADNGLV